MSLLVIDDSHKYTVVRAANAPGPGGALHNYVIESKPLEGIDPETNAGFITESKELLAVNFQHGPIKEAGVNGVMDENLIAIVIDRLEGFQKGPYACEDNQGALDSLKIAAAYLSDRTKKREKQGIEGTHQVGEESKGFNAE